MTEERDPIDLTNCDREPIHIPGSIQPHGVLLVMTEPELVVIQVSENVIDHIGMRTEDVLTRPLSALFDRSSVEAVRTALSGGPSERANAIRIVTSGKPFDAIVHRHEGGNPRARAGSGSLHRRHGASPASTDPDSPAGRGHGA
jgi:chemotaxis family two-component system sensor kinase Cph1